MGVEGQLVDIAEEGFDCGIRAVEFVSDDMVAISIGPDQQHIVVTTTYNFVVDQPRLLLAVALDGCGIAYVTRWMVGTHLPTGDSGRCWQTGRRPTLAYACTTRDITAWALECARLSIF
ncbi:DNA-binding transcriptional LysR family regulator [Agrobacterium pusense]|uniref:hypothetical protein n=1 Tax=Agrobacterium pusense TaxID=648995 RepID=UPI002864665A|nr:hypothetical protein [Agrobacterium pusense]MDR6192898.1 DNA-binding transcriptional LysR family regulator [Agrobacterium pusense]